MNVTVLVKATRDTCTYQVFIDDIPNWPAASTRKHSQLCSVFRIYCTLYL